VLCAASSKDQVEQDKFTKWPIKMDEKKTKKAREKNRKYQQNAIKREKNTH
jgi:hypothetical protein